MLGTKVHSEKSKSPGPAESAEKTTRQREASTFNPLWARLALQVQPKLAISAPDDPSEREADEVADRVTRMPGASAAPNQFQSLQIGTAVTSSDHLHRQCSSCAANDSETDDLSATVSRATASSGRALDDSTRGAMESRFGHDFGQVRVHTGSVAADSARSINALAYTVGSNIVFGDGQYAPNTDPGRRLLAHELTHTVQQGGGGENPSIQRQLMPPVPLVVRPSTEALEVNAVDARQEPDTSWYKPWRYAGPLANFFRGDVTMTNIATMVTNVLNFLNGRSMGRLNVVDHGNEQGAEIGDDWLTTAASVVPFAGTLGRLGPRFGSGAFVHMQNCHVGQNQALICALARAFTVPVYAGTGYHNPLLQVNYGDYVKCDPSGTFTPNVSRPQTPTLPPPDTSVASNDTPGADQGAGAPAATSPSESGETATA